MHFKFLFKLESWSQGGSSLKATRSYCAISQGAVLGWGGGCLTLGASQLESWDVCFRAQHGVSTSVTVVNKEYLAQGSVCLNGAHGVMSKSSPEGAPVSCSDTCHLSTPLMYLNLSMPLRGFWASQGDPHPVPTMGAIGGTLWEMVRKGAGMWEPNGDVQRGPRFWAVLL